MIIDDENVAMYKRESENKIKFKTGDKSMEVRYP